MPIAKGINRAVETTHNGRVIDVKKLTKKYNTPAGEFTALEEVDLQVEAGEFIAVLGKSGAGKSTLINMITGIDRPTAGKVHIDGISIHTLGEDQLARWRGRTLGIVFQFFQLLPSLSLIENITLAMDFAASLPLAERRQRAMELLDQVGIAEHAHKTPAKISGGQQQRVAIARALANNPALIVADEPTGNLDSHTAAGIMDLFTELVECGKTLVVVTHEIGVAQRADRLLHIEDGRLRGGGDRPIGGKMDGTRPRAGTAQGGEAVGKTDGRYAHKLPHCDHKE